MHRLEYTEWETATGKYRCNDIKDLVGISSKWWVPARMLNMTLENYIIMLKDTFHANIESYYEPTDVLLYSFDNKSDCHKFVLFINNKAKKINYLV